MAPGYLDLRRFPRIHVEEGFSIRFQAGDRWFFGLPVTTLGGGGCCFRVSVLLAGNLAQGAVLSRLCIEHPGLPRAHQRARITWIQGDPRGGEDPTVLVGIEYLDPDPDFIQAVDRCITALQRQEAPR